MHTATQRLRTHPHYARYWLSPTHANILKSDSARRVLLVALAISAESFPKVAAVCARMSWNELLTAWLHEPTQGYGMYMGEQNYDHMAGGHLMHHQETTLAKSPGIKKGRGGAGRGGGASSKRRRAADAPKHAKSAYIYYVQVCDLPEPRFARLLLFAVWVPIIGCLTVAMKPF